MPATLVEVSLRSSRWDPLTAPRSAVAGTVEREDNEVPRRGSGFESVVVPDSVRRRTGHGHACGRSAARGCQPWRIVNHVQLNSCLVRTFYAWARGERRCDVQRHVAIAAAPARRRGPSNETVRRDFADAGDAHLGAEAVLVLRDRPVSLRWRRFALLPPVHHGPNDASRASRSRSRPAPSFHLRALSVA